MPHLGSPLGTASLVGRGYYVMNLGLKKCHWMIEIFDKPRSQDFVVPKVPPFDLEQYC